MSAPALRAARREEAGVLAVLVQGLLTAHGAAPDPEKAAARAAHLLADYDVVFFTQADAIIGYAASIDHGDHVFLRHFALAPDHRGRGLGRAAFALFCDERLGGRELRLDAAMHIPGPRAFWEKMGLRVAAWSMKRDAEAG